MELQENLITDITKRLIPEIEKLNASNERKNWYVSSLQHRLQEAKKIEGNLAIAIFNALEKYTIK